MKQLIRQLRDKANELMDQDVATNGRSKFFRVTVISLLAATASLAIFNMIKTLT